MFDSKWALESLRNRGRTAKVSYSGGSYWIRVLFGAGEGLVEVWQCVWSLFTVPCLMNRTFVSITTSYSPSNLVS